MIAYAYPFKPREPSKASATSKYLAMLARPRGWTSNTRDLRRMYRIDHNVLSASARHDIHGERIMRYQVRTNGMVLLVFKEGIILRSRINWGVMRRRMASIHASRVAGLLLCARRRGVRFDEPGLGRVIRDFFRPRRASAEQSRPGLTDVSVELSRVDVEFV